MTVRMMKKTVRAGAAAPALIHFANARNNITVLYFSHLALGQHVDHDLRYKTERTDERLAIGEHVELPRAVM